MAGLLSLEMGDTDKTFKNIAECRERGIRILPPDVNESREDFTVLAQADDNGLRPIRFGLCAVRGVGSKAVETILATRDAARPVHQPGQLLQARPRREERRSGPSVPMAARGAAGRERGRRKRVARGARRRDPRRQRPHRSTRR